MMDLDNRKIGKKNWKKTSILIPHFAVNKIKKKKKKLENYFVDVYFCYCFWSLRDKLYCGYIDDGLPTRCGLAKKKFFFFMKTLKKEVRTC